MEVSLWAEIRRLHEVEGLSQRAIARRLHCCRSTVGKALALSRPPDATQRVSRGSVLEPYKPKIDALVARYPELSAVRLWEEIHKGPDGYQGSVITVRRYVRTIRPARGRVYQEVVYEPGQAIQVDWGHCGQIKIENTTRKVSVLVAVLCYSRLCYIEFTLSQRKAEFYRAIAHALEFWGGSPRRIIFDNLKAAVLNGSGRHACLHPEFLALCGYFCLEPIACERRDPESKGMVEAHVRYVKHNALQGRLEQLTTWQDYQQLAVTWRDEVANVRLHQTTRERPLDRFEQERSCLRPLPKVPLDTDEVVTAVVTSHARISFDGNRYSVPPEVARKPVVLRANADQVRVLYEGREVARHQRSYGRRQLICQAEHQLQALQMRRRIRGRHLEEAFDALGEVAREFHLKLRTRPVRTTHHLRRLLGLVRLYGRAEVLAAIARAHEYQTYDAAYVETLLLQERRRRELPSPTALRPQRQELIDEIDVEDPDPSLYDRFLETGEDEEEDHDET
ncbi:MAG: IS21 family transposase [Planctomycetota bacterium]